MGKLSRSPSGYRLYSEETERFLRFLKKARVLGFTLQEIKAIWEIRATGRKPCKYVKEQSQRKRATSGTRASSACPKSSWSTA